VGSIRIQMERFCGHSQNQHKPKPYLCRLVQHQLEQARSFESMRKGSRVQNEPRE